MKNERIPTDLQVISSTTEFHDEAVDEEDGTLKRNMFSKQQARGTFGITENMELGNAEYMPRISVSQWMDELKHRGENLCMAG